VVGFPAQTTALQRNEGLQRPGIPIAVIAAHGADQVQENVEDSVTIEFG